MISVTWYARGVPDILCNAAGVLSPATSDEGKRVVNDYLVLGANALTLIAAIALLVVALLLKQVASGSVVAENISWVSAACVCLAASVLAQWTSLFLPAGSLAARQAVLGSDLLTLVALVLLCLYFWRVRQALRRFVTALKGDSVLARAQGAGETDEGADG